MPRISEGNGPSNADIDNEPDFFFKGGGLASVGISSSTYEKKQEWSGSGAQGTDQSTQSPAPDAESPSEQDPQAEQAPSSTVLLTDGNTHETGPSQQSLLDSSEVMVPAPPVTPETTKERKNAQEMLKLARDAYDAEDYDMAEELLDEADLADPKLEPQITEARAEILTARAIRGK